MNPMKLMMRWFETSSKKQKLTAALPVFSLLATVVLLVANGSSETTTDPLGSTPLYFAGVFVKLVGVLLLIVASSAVLRRWSQLGSNGKAIRQLHLLETVRLSPKQALHLVSIGDQRLLIGATDQNISLLSQIDGSLNFAPTEAVSSQPALDFSSLLRTFNSHPPTEASK